MTRKKTSLVTLSGFLKFLPWIAIVLVVGLGFYFYKAARQTDVESEGIVVCNDAGVCEKSWHIHSTLDVSICGRQTELAKEEGELSDIHTHKEDNLLHFHERLKVDSNGNVLDWAPLTLSNSVKAVAGMSLTNECIGEYCNGSLCPDGEKGELNVTVGGVRQEDIASYVWKDGDEIRIEFGTLER